MNDDEEEKILNVGVRGGPCTGTAIYCRSADRYYGRQIVMVSTVSFRLCINDIVQVVE